MALFLVATSLCLTFAQTPGFGWARSVGPWKVAPPDEARVTQVKEGHCFLDKGWSARFVEGIELGLYRGKWLINVGRVSWSGDNRCRVTFSGELMTPRTGDAAALPPVLLDRARPPEEYLDKGLASLRRGAYNMALASLFHAHTLDSRCRGAQLAIANIFRRYEEWDLSILWSARAAGLNDSAGASIMRSAGGRRNGTAERGAKRGAKRGAVGSGSDPFNIANSHPRGHAMVTGKSVPDLSLPSAGRTSPGCGDSPTGHDSPGGAERAGGLVNIGLCLMEKNDPAGALHTFLTVCKEYPEDMRTRALAWLGSGIAGRMILDRGEAWGARYADAGLAGFRRAWKGSLGWLDEMIPKGTRARAVMESGFFGKK